MFAEKNSYAISWLIRIAIIIRNRWKKLWKSADKLRKNMDAIEKDNPKSLNVL